MIVLPHLLLPVTFIPPLMQITISLINIVTGQWNSQLLCKCVYIINKMFHKIINFSIHICLKMAYYILNCDFLCFEVSLFSLEMHL